MTQITGRYKLTRRAHTSYQSKAKQKVSPAEHDTRVVGNGNRHMVGIEEQST